MKLYIALIIAGYLLIGVGYFAGYKVGNFDYTQSLSKSQDNYVRVSEKANALSSEVNSLSSDLNQIRVKLKNARRFDGWIKLNPSDIP